MTTSDDPQLSVNPRAAAYGEALRRLRRLTGISQAEAARAAGLSQAAWTKYERGRSLAFLNLLNQDRCAQALGRTLGDLEAMRAMVEGGDAGATAMPQHTLGLHEDGAVYDPGACAGDHRRTLTVADDTMAPYAARGESVIYSLTAMLRSEQGVVLKRRDGQRIIRRYMQTTATDIICLRMEPIHGAGRTGWVEHEDRYPVADIEGVYAILWRGMAW